MTRPERIWRLSSSTISATEPRALPKACRARGQTLTGWVREEGGCGEPGNLAYAAVSTYASAPMAPIMHYYVAVPPADASTINRIRHCYSAILAPDESDVEDVAGSQAVCGSEPVSDQVPDCDTAMLHHYLCRRGSASELEPLRPVEQVCVDVWRLALHVWQGELWVWFANGYAHRANEVQDALHLLGADSAAAPVKRGVRIHTRAMAKIKKYDGDYDHPEVGAVIEWQLAQTDALNLKLNALDPSLPQLLTRYGRAMLPPEVWDYQRKG